MNPPNPFDLGQMALASTALGGVTLVLARILHRRAFFVALAALGVPFFGVFLWSRGDFTGMTITWTAILSLVSVSIALPVAILLRRLGRAPVAVAVAAKPPERFGRRALLFRGASAAAPLVAATAGPTALWEAAAEPSAKRIRIACASLPPALDGMCILHLSDLHLGASKTSADLARFLEGAPRPDLVLVTGDFADDPRELTKGLALLADFGPPVYASLGNHEYLRGIDVMLPRYRASKVRLLRDEHTVVRVRGADLVLAGIDDPAWNGGSRRFFENAIDDALAGSPASAFRILLSHRPRALDVASTRGIGLVLSGHTHGAQLGMLGRSMLEPLLPREYLWGQYRKKSTVLYTTSGFGHWFPFRLGCPTEAPLLVLERAA